MIKKVEEAERYQNYLKYLQNNRQGRREQLCRLYPEQDVQLRK